MLLLVFIEISSAKPQAVFKSVKLTHSPEWHGFPLRALKNDREELNKILSTKSLVRLRDKQSQQGEQHKLCMFVSGGLNVSFKSSASSLSLYTCPHLYFWPVFSLSLSHPHQLYPFMLISNLPTLWNESRVHSFHLLTWISSPSLPFSLSASLSLIFLAAEELCLDFIVNANTHFLSVLPPKFNSVSWVMPGMSLGKCLGSLWQNH